MGLFDFLKAKRYKEQIRELETKLDDLGYTEYAETQKAIQEMKDKAEAEFNANKSDKETTLNLLNTDISEANQTICKLNEQITSLQESFEKYDKQCTSALKKLNKAKELYRAVDFAVRAIDNEVPGKHLLYGAAQAEFDELAPTVTLKLHCMDMKDLRRAFRENEKHIETVVTRYKDRYTTKTNKTIYDLMVIALKAELQNILYTLKFEKLDKAVESVKVVTNKYLTIATNGNQSIAPTITKFVSEIEYLFVNAVKIEYNYYVKKEQARQEQLAIREQMRQEAEERKALELERKKIEAEEQKYKNEIERIKEQLNTVDEETAAKLREELMTVESNLADVVVKKEDIVNLQNGKAGNIYIISNLGSFGENIFKIGMTRRLDPQDRVDELGSASVPFKFDVHSFIFSDDAVSLETELHRRLDEKRVNKVNRRKEFFYSTLDELEALTNELSPSAEFNRTMIAEEFRQSLSTTENYSTDYSLDDDEED